MEEDWMTAEQRRLVLETDPELTELPDGNWRAEWGGHVGVGKTRKEAAAEAAEKVVSALIRPPLGETSR